MNSDPIAWLGQTTLATSAALLFVLLLRRPLRAAFGAGAAYALWALVPVALIAVLLPAPAVPVALVPVAVGFGAMQSVALAPQASDLPWTSVLLVVWSIGALAMAALQLWQQRRFLRRLGPLRVHGRGLHVAATSAGLPAVTGVLRPRILLPADFLWRYDADERALVVAHERQHIARGDLPCNALVALLRCAYWFNPLLHWAVARYRHDQELACDARVLRLHPRARRTYAQAMLKTQLDDFALPVGCHWPTHPIKERIAMLKRPSPRRWQTRLSAVLLLALFAGGGYVAWAQQPAAAPSVAHPAAQVAAQVGSKAQIKREDRHPAPPREEQALPFDPSEHAPPRYPKEAANNGISGRVVMLVDVAADGSVQDVRIEQARPAGVFEAVSLEAARKWKFKPVLERGKPVAHRVRVPIDFDLDAPSAPRGGVASASAESRELAGAAARETAPAPAASMVDRG